MFFPRNSSRFQTILLRVKSMRFLCYSRLFAPLLRPSHAFQLRDWSTLFLWQSSLYYSLATLHNSRLFPCFSPHYDSITLPRDSLLCLHFSVFRYSISRLFSADTLPRGPSHFLRLTTRSPRHSRHFLSLPLPNESSLYFSMATQRQSTTLPPPLKQVV